MKYLKIENNKGFFIKETGDDGFTWREIDQISKEDLLFLINQAILSDFQMDIFDESLLLNKAHQIIYRNLSDKFGDLVSNKTRFKDESESLFKAALEKYS